jgi:catechol 2,3-dioxygenase-like lactoylglutathione lyase family enzyme
MRKRATARLTDLTILVLGCLASLAAAGVARAQAAAPEAAGRVLGMAYVGRMVADLDKAMPFYKALGFTVDPATSTGWHKDDALDRLFGVRGAQYRVAKLGVNSSLSGKSFNVYLRELKGVPRKKLAGYTTWEPGATHFGLIVPDAEALWSQLQARGNLRARSWDSKLIALPGQTRGSLAYLTDPDGLDIEIINQRPATPAADGRPARPASLPGINHVGLVVLDSEKSKAFYGELLGGQLVAGAAPWLQGDFYDSAVGGHGNILRLMNESFAEAAAPDARLNFEIVEYQNRKKPVEKYGIADASVGTVGFEVQGLDGLLARLKAAGAQVVSEGGIVTLTDGTKSVIVRDPDVGGFVELVERQSRTAQGQSLSGESLVSALRTGGYVIVMRHASSPRTPATAEQANTDNVQKERQLDEIGRASARALGDALRQLRIPIGPVLSSPTYRALETVRLARLGDPQIATELGDAGQSMQSDATGTRSAWMRGKVAETPRPGMNTLLVTHFPNVMEAFPTLAEGLADGEMLIFRPDGKGSAAFVARIKTDEWPRLSSHH